MKKKVKASAKQEFNKIDFSLVQKSANFPIVDFAGDLSEKGRLHELFAMAIAHWAFMDIDVWYDNDPATSDPSYRSQDVSLVEMRLIKLFGVVPCNLDPITDWLDVASTELGLHVTDSTLVDHTLAERMGKAILRRISQNPAAIGLDEPPKKKRSKAQAFKSRDEMVFELRQQGFDYADIVKSVKDDLNLHVSKENARTIVGRMRKKQ